MKRMFIKSLIGITMIGTIMLNMVACGGNITSKVVSSENAVESTENEVYLADKVYGVKDIETIVNNEVDFMNGITWDEEYVDAVEPDIDGDVLSCVGEHELPYIIHGVDGSTERTVVSLRVLEVGSEVSEVTSSEEVKTENIDATSEGSTPSESSVVTSDGGTVSNEGNTSSEGSSSNVSNNISKSSNSSSKVSVGNSSTPSNTSSSTTSSAKPTESVPQPTHTEQPAQPVHVHDWKPVYRTVHHDAITHQEDRGHYERTPYVVYWVNSRKEEYLDFDTAMDRVDEIIIANSNGDYSASPNNGQTVRYEQKWVSSIVTVVDKNAWDEQVVDHYQCSCGVCK